MLRVNGRTFYAMFKDSSEKELFLFGPRSRVDFLDAKLKMIGLEGCKRVSDDDDGISIPLSRLLEEAPPGGCMIVLLHDDYFAAADLLEGMGYRPGWDFRWIKRYGMENLRTRYRFDPMLGFNTVGDEGTPGFFALGDPDNRAAKRIVILGGSSTDPGSYHFRSWPEYLKDLLDEVGAASVVFNGAVTGYTSAQEALKLMRDVMALRPDIVVSLSGINNNHLVNKHPFYIDYNMKLGSYFASHEAPTVNMSRLLPFEALDYQAEGFDKYEWWLDHERAMRYFCELKGVRFFCFLQPNLMSKREEAILPEEREYLLNRSFMGRQGLTPQGYRDITRGFCDLLEGLPCDGWLYDLTDIFDSEPRSVYEDGIHVDERGNQLTAEAVFDRISEALR